MFVENLTPVNQFQGNFLNKKVKDGQTNRPADHTYSVPPIFSLEAIQEKSHRAC